MATHTPWPSDFSELKKLEDILQCPICYEYIDTCMITTCSHNFCSLCIRKYLQFKTQCPTCFEEAHGSDLRKNRLLDDIINIYVKLKDRLLFTLRLVTMTQSVKGESKPTDDTVSPSKVSESVKKESKTPKGDRNKKPVVQKLFSEKKASLDNSEAKPIVVDGVVIPSMFQPQKSPKKSVSKNSMDKSTCPVCNVDVPLKNLNMHLDSCLAASDPDSRHKPKPEKREPIPKRVYTMMKDKEIKKYLKDYGLNTNGDRKAMISRITRYVVIYNAECDKEYPRPVSELLKQIEREEKDEKSVQSNSLFPAARPPTIPPEKKKDPETIEKINKDYLDLNRDNFKKLIEAMRQRDGRNIKPLKPLNRIDSDDEVEVMPLSSIDQLPSTSKDNKDPETISIYSQDTVADSDSDSDIIEKTPVKVEAQVHRPGLINWDKTRVKDDPATQPTQNGINDITPAPLTDDSDSYDSVFNTSTASELSKTPTNKTPLSSRKRSKLSTTPSQSPIAGKIAEKFDEIFDGKAGVALTNGKSKHVNGKNKQEDEDEEEEDDDDDDDESDNVSFLGTPVKAYNISPEISPMKTRSAKRKCIERSASKTSVSPGKRMKQSASPLSPEI